MLRSLGVETIWNFLKCSLEIIKHLTYYSDRLFWIVLFVLLKLVHVRWTTPR